MLMSTHIAGGGAVVAIANIATADSTSGGPAQSGIRINIDGTISVRTSGGYTYETDWITPTSAASSAYQFRVTGVTWTAGSSFNLVEAAAEDTWIAVSGGGLEWSVTDTSPTFPAGLHDVDFTLEVRRGTGTTLDTAAISLFADYTV